MAVAFLSGICLSVKYRPKINLTLNTSSRGIDGKLNEDNSVILKLLYGANDAQKGMEWMERTLSQYTMGVIKDGNSKTVTPVVQAARKKRGRTEKYDVKATIYELFLSGLLTAHSCYSHPAVNKVFLSWHLP